MVPIALLITALGLAFLMLGLRGRVAQRGVFCRRCKFDLAGIDTQSESSKCPECGQTIGAQGATRDIRRVKRKGLIILSSVVLLLGIGLGVVGMTGNAASLYNAMPDRVVLFASQWGSDEALDELLIRLSATNPIDQWVWDDAIELGLVYQADTSLKWDSRWGEVISLAWQGNHLSEEQKLQFAFYAFDHEYLIRDRMRIDDFYISHMLKESSTRQSALNRFQTGYRLRMKDHASGGLFGDETWESTVGGSMSTTFSFLRQGSTGTSAMGGGITVPRHIRDQLNVGDEISVYFEYQITLERQSDERITESDAIRFDRTVRIIGADEPMVRVIDDPLSAKAIIEGAHVEPLIGLILGSVEYGRHDELASLKLSFSRLPRAISGEVFLQHPTDGERIIVGTMALEGQSDKLTNWSHGYQLGVTTDGETDILETLQRVTRDGVVDVIFETDPTAAERNPVITEVVDLEILFDGVPVQWYQTRGEIYEAQSQSERISASNQADD